MSKKNDEFWEIYTYAREVIQKYYCKRCGKYDLNENDKEDCLAYLEDVFFRKWEKFDTSKGTSEKTFVNIILSSAEKDFCKKKRYKRNGETKFYSTVNIESHHLSDDNGTSMNNFILDYFSKETSEDIEMGVINKIMLERIFSKLTQNEILILTLKYIDGYKSKEIAPLFNITEREVNKKIEQIKKKIKKSFNNENADE